MSDVQVLHGDALELLPTLDAASVDAVITDPPYGLEFMGREWDRFAGDVTDRDFKGFVLSQQRTRNVKCPECGKWAYDHPGRLCECGGIRRAQGSAYQHWCEQWAVECLRVLKPGGYLLAFGGTRTHHHLACAIEDAGFEIRDSIAWIYATGFPKSLNVGDGRGTALKPAHETIVVARKPLTGTVAANVLEHGTGALNIDGCRVEGESWSFIHGPKTGRSAGIQGTPAAREGIAESHPAGRWPPNVVLDEAAAAELDRQSGERPSGSRAEGVRTGLGYHGANGDGGPAIEGSTGGASRFFPTFRYEPKAPADQRPRVNGTSHPTVKPLDLIRWLVRLVTPPGGLVLDLFAGSGTTGEACLIEGFDCVLIEREADYLPLIKARLDKPIQPTLGMAP
jgi:site-specific DNA-methyltransferase (adenine-specific)